MKTPFWYSYQVLLLMQNGGEHDGFKKEMAIKV